MAEDSEANSKEWNKLPRAVKFQRYPIVLNVSKKLQKIVAHIAVEIYGFESFAKLLQLG